MTCLPMKSQASFFTNHYLGSFEMVDLVWKNQNRFSYIEDQLKIPVGTGQSIVEYVKFLYTNQIEEYGAAFSWAQTNYNNLQVSVESYYELFMVELYARGFQNKFNADSKIKCEDYFQK